MDLEGKNGYMRMKVRGMTSLKVVEKYWKHKTITVGEAKNTSKDI